MNWIITVLALVLVLVLWCWWRQRFWFALALLSLSVVLLEQFGEQQIQALYQRELHLRTVEKLGNLRGRLETVLANKLSLVSGAAAYIVSQAELDQQKFASYAQAVLLREPQLINLAAAPDLVVRYIYPLQGNESVLGLDYRKNAEQWPAVERVINSGTLTVAGPVELVQGGTAFIGRAPVYNKSGARDRDLWGLVSAPIMASAVYQSAGLYDLADELELAIRGRDGLPGSKAFFGDDLLFDDARAVTMSLVVGNGEWQLAARPRAGWQAPAERIWPLRIVSPVLLLLLSLALFFRFRHLQEHQVLAAALALNEEFLRDVETIAQVGGWCVDRHGEFKQFSAQGREIIQGYGLTVPESMSDLAGYFRPEQSRQLLESLERALKDGLAFELELEVQRASTDWRPWLRVIGNPNAPDGQVIEIVGAIQDITHQKEAERIIEYHAQYDTLTGLPNRSLFKDRMETAIAKASRAHTRMGVLFIDLDNFKSVNDNLGHATGDELLVAVAERIKSCVRQSDTVARQGGDEFAAIIENIDGEQGAYKVAEKIVDSLAHPFKVAEHQIYSGASIGISVFPDDATDAETLLGNADQAMYEVKKSGRNGWQFCTREMQRRSETRHRLFNDIRAALDEGEFSAHFQPIVDLRTNTVISCEALARWQRADGSWVSPGEFVDVAEETGLINRIDQVIAGEALNFLAALCQRLDRKIGLSVNVSPRVFFAKDQSLQRWLELLKSAHPSVSVTVEITERLLLDDSDRARLVLEQLRDAGIGISLDDFGTGYSSLSYLARFPVDTIKIDRSFINGIGTASNEEALVETILMMASRLGKRVVAEGVEESEQLAFLRDHGCDMVQGYFLARPMSGPDLETFLGDWQAPA